MTVQVDHWKPVEAQILKSAGAEYNRIARELEQRLASLQGINNTIYYSQVSGPPAEYMNSIWNDWNRKTGPLLERIRALSRDLNRQADSWLHSYQEQVRRAEDEARRQAEEAKRQAEEARKRNEESTCHS